MEKKELRLNLTLETTEKFRTAYYESGCKSYEEFISKLVDEPTTSNPEPTTSNRFQLLITNNAVNDTPIIEAENPEAAKKELLNRLPHATIHHIKNSG